MSIKIMTRVWEKSQFKGSKLLLLLAIADNANDKGEAWPGVEYLAKKTRLTERHITRLITELNKSDELAVIRGGRYQGDSNFFYVLTGMSLIDKEVIKEHVRLEGESVYPDNLSGLNEFTPTKSAVYPDIAMSPESLTVMLNNHDADNNCLQLWQQAQALLSTQMGLTTFELWIKRTHVMEIDDNTWVLGVESQPAKDWIDARYKKLIEDTLSFVVGEKTRIKVQVAIIAQLPQQEHAHAENNE